jgi:hypothetical protein
MHYYGVLINYIHNIYHIQMLGFFFHINQSTLSSEPGQCLCGKDGNEAGTLAKVISDSIEHLNIRPF